MGESRLRDLLPGGGGGPGGTDTRAVGPATVASPRCAFEFQFRHGAG